MLKTIHIATITALGFCTFSCQSNDTHVAATGACIIRHEGFQRGSRLNTHRKFRLPPAINFRTKESFIQVITGKIRIIETGTQNGPAILLLHGATFRAELWQDLGTMRLLASHGFHIISADLPGHGKTHRLTIPQNRFIKNLVDALHIEQLSIVAHSYGGSFALPFIVSQPHRLKRVVLVAPTGISKNAKQLKNTSVQTLIVWGQDDELIPVSRAVMLNSLIPTSSLTTIPRAGHECYNDQKELFHTTIFDFFKPLLQ